MNIKQTIKEIILYARHQPGRALLLPFAKVGLLRAYNSLVSFLNRHHLVHTDLDELNLILSLSRQPSAISDHLITLFLETLSLKPRLIVKLGTRGGWSTSALASAAKSTGARIISVDIEDRSKQLPTDILPPDKWIFVKWIL